MSTVFMFTVAALAREPKSAASRSFAISASPWAFMWIPLIVQGVGDCCIAARLGAKRSTNRAPSRAATRRIASV